MRAKVRARKAVEQLNENNCRKVDWELDYVEEPVEKVAEIIYAAILADREECAKVVERMGPHEFEWAATRIRRRK